MKKVQKTFLLLVQQRSLSFDIFLSHMSPRILQKGMYIHKLIMYQSEIIINLPENKTFKGQ